MEVSKSDWKLFRARIGDWQEAYMERLVKGYMDLLGGAENASDKFWKLKERIKKDKKHPDFMFQLTKDEWENLRCKNFTSSWGGSRYLPMAFTEQGIYMLMTVLRGELAVQQSRALVRAFKKMKESFYVVHLLKMPVLE